MKRHDDRRERGMVTAEFAATLPAVVLVLCLVMGVVQTLVTQQQATHAAIAAARVAARGEPATRVQAVAQQAGPAHATARVSSSGDFVTVRIEAQAPSVLGWILPAASAEATSLKEAAINDESAASGK